MGLWRLNVAANSKARTLFQVCLPERAVWHGTGKSERACSPCIIHCAAPLSYLLNSPIGWFLTIQNQVNSLPDNQFIADFLLCHYKCTIICITNTNSKQGLDSFLEYMEVGGFAEYISSHNQSILTQLFNDLIYRDIIVRHGIRNAKVVKELGVYLASNIGKEFSYNKLAKVFSLGSVNTVLSYISFFEDAYFFTIKIRGNAILWFLQTNKLNN